MSFKKIENYLIDSKNKNDENKYGAALLLKQSIEKEYKESTNDAQVKLMNYVNDTTLRLLKSSDVGEKKSGLILIFYLIELEVSDYGLRMKCLKEITGFSPTPDLSLMELNAAVFIKYVQLSYVPSDMFDHEIKKAKKCLTEEQGDRKCYTLIFYRECSKSIPTMFFPYIFDSFHGICACLTDPKPIIRETSIVLIRNCFSIFVPRENRDSSIQRCYETLYKTLSLCLQVDPSKSISDDIIYGSLMALQEILRISNGKAHAFINEIFATFTVNVSLTKKTSINNENRIYNPKWMSSVVLNNKKVFTEIAETKPVIHSTFCYNLIENHFIDIMEYLLKLSYGKNPQIVQLVLQLVPILTTFNKNKFVTEYIHVYMNVIFRILSTSRDKTMLFLSLTMLTNEITTSLTPYMRKILECISLSIPAKEVSGKRRLVVFDPMALACLSSIAPFCPKEDCEFMYSIFKNAIENSQLTPAIVSGMAKSVKYISNSHNLINDLIHIILQRVLKLDPLKITVDSKIESETTTDEEEMNLIVLALRTIRMFEIIDLKIKEKLYYASQMYLNSVNKVIRLEAVQTCCEIISTMTDSVSNKKLFKLVNSKKMANKIYDFLKKLLIVGITDVEPDIRLCALVCLDDCNDVQLAHPELINIFFIGLRDEVVEIREIVVCILGRLSTINPSYITPILDKYLIECLTELKHNRPNSSIETSARMMRSLVSNTPRLAFSCMKPIVKFIQPCINDPKLSPDFISIMLVTISDLTFFCGKKMLGYAPDLIFLIKKIIVSQGPSNLKQCAVTCISVIIRNTGFMIVDIDSFIEIYEALMSLIKNENSKSIRRAIIDALGCLGARDSYQIQRKLTAAHDILELSTEEMNITPWDQAHKNKNICEILEIYERESRIEEFYSGVCIYYLLKILTDNSLSSLHSLVVQMIQNIYVMLGSKSFQYLSQIFPAYISVVKSCDPDMKKILLEQIGKLVSIAKTQTRPYINDLFSLIDEIWVDSAPIGLQSTIIKVIEYLITSIPDETSARLPSIIPKMASILFIDRKDASTPDENQLTTLLLSAIQRVGSFLKEYLSIIIPGLIKGFDDSNKPVPLQILALKTIESLLSCNDLKEFVSPILQALIRTFNTKLTLHTQCTSLLIALICHAPSNMKNYIPLLSQIIAKHKLNTPDLDLIMEDLNSMASHKLEQNSYYHRNFSLNNVSVTGVGNISSASTTNLGSGFTTLSSGNTLKKDESAGGSGSSSNLASFTVNTSNLMRVWQTTQRVSREDWCDWLQRLAMELVKESPSGIIRSCLAIAQSHSQLGKLLFNYSFYSCWKELNHSSKDDFSKCLSQAIGINDVNEVVLTILNLAEFMDHTQSDQLPLPSQKLAECALKTSAYAKALRFTEQTFRKGDSIDVLQSLIFINTVLNNTDAAEGVLLYAVKENAVDLRLQQRWYEKLHDWNKAISSYDCKLEQDPNDMELLMGKMRCLEALCEWKQLDKMVSKHWPNVDEAKRVELARIGSLTSIGLGQYDKLKSYANCVPKKTFDGSFIRAIHYVQNDMCDKSIIFLQKARDLLDNELSTFVAESYERGYRTVFTCQLLSELEEVINYKLFPMHRDTIKEIWHNRILKCRRVVSDWQRILDIRSLVLQPKDSIKTWLKFSSLCRKEGNNSLCRSAFERLLSQENIDDFYNNNIPDVRPSLAFNFIRHMWSSNRQELAFDLMKKLTTIIPAQSSDFDIANTSLNTTLKRLLSKCYVQLGIWETATIYNEENVTAASKYFSTATKEDNKYYKSWHSWALLNYEIILHNKHKTSTPDIETENTSTDHQELNSSDTVAAPTVSYFVADKNKLVKAYVVPAIRAFFRSINLWDKNLLQDILRLITLWFEYGDNQEVCDVVDSEMYILKIEYWLQVIPQLIARLDTPKRRVRKMIQQLLIKVGQHHPQAFIYPLMVSSKSDNDVRTIAVTEILKSVSENFPGLVDQAYMVSNELIRVSILWTEEWIEVLEEASRLYFYDKNIEGMLDIIDAMHAKMKRGAETLKEVGFLQNYDFDLKEAQRLRQIYGKTNDLKDLAQAWDIYYQLFRRLSKQSNQFTSIDLEYASPKLLKSNNLILAIPGTYQTHLSTICIQSVQPTLKVIGSKQKPRKLTMIGNDGKAYEFLLKGHEDLRQDERVMQLFGLLNDLLISNPGTFKRRLEIKRYSVTPLSTNSGLIGWVPHCDTLSSLIREYRENTGVYLSHENRIINKNCSEYDSLELLHKMELFEYILENTSDDDLAHTLWSKSLSSEIWFEKRTNFTRSLALMSMVGYMLGLGDRHPSNIMLERTSGRIIHIDFGDCFEVAMARERFPEKVPFRLTRMLIKSMEVTGIEGTFKITCIRVMEMLRSNKDSMLAVLEAFIYDPLLNWRLIENKQHIEKATVFSTISDNIRDEVGSKDKQVTTKLSSTVIDNARSEKQIKPEVLNAKAIIAINRVKDKLYGKDFKKHQVVDVTNQVDLLINQATSVKNLTRSYIGWCPYW